jgi:succinyl-diaminopimelate desuccinylase
MVSNTIELAKELISRESITPNDAGCQKIITDRLLRMGFNIEEMPFADVQNVYARRGDKLPLLLFAGHTDVVPTGPIEQWLSSPFQPTVQEGRLFGRGAADMKGSLAAMVCACEAFTQQFPGHQGSIAFLMTSDEEGEAVDGTAKVVEQLIARGEDITWCIVGEASSEKTLGDVVKVGRRGSLNGKLLIFGQQGHIAYPQQAKNPIHHVLPALKELCETEWDQGNEYFPATSFQISNIHAGTGAGNVIPGDLVTLFNFRYSTEVTTEELQQRVLEVLARHSLDYKIDWVLSGTPFLSHRGKLFAATSQAVSEIMQTQLRASTGGGTSDGRFIAKTGCEILEIGPTNATVHQINESVSVKELEQLTEIYCRILALLLL